MSEPIPVELDFPNPCGFLRGDPLDIDSPYFIVGLINRGGAGVVYRALFKGMDRAIKILAPKALDISKHPDELDKKEWELYASTFREEIEVLTRISHPNISRILDSGVCGNGRAAGRPFYVMELIEGLPFLEAIHNFKPPATDILRLIDDILEALVFLHGQKPRPIMHMDVKSENILVRNIGTRLQAVLVDLGVAKPLPQPGQTTYTTYRTTRANTRAERQGYVHTSVTPDFINSIFPDEDLFELGQLLRQVFSLALVKTNVISELDEAGSAALQFVLNKLTGPQSQQYETINEVRQYIRKLFPDYTAPLGVSELGISGDTVKNIAIPNGRIRLTRRLAKLVDSPLFQRLQRLHQLNFVYLILPGAHHTRFLHLLHSYSLCREYIWALLEDARFRLAASKHDLEAILLYTLLHDIGHYPLSHMFEDFQEVEASRSVDTATLTDEQMLECLLFPDKVVGHKREVAELLRLAFRKDGIDELHQYLSEFSSPTLERLSELLGPSNPTDRVGKVLRGLIDSPIDVDKAAYLQLDSWMTGIDYGKGIDIEGLLSGLRYPREEDIDKASKAIIAITDKGLSAVESLVLARYWMIKRVYWHHTNRAIMAMVKFVVVTLNQIKALDFKQYIKAVFFGTDLDALRFLCNLWDVNKGLIDAFHYGNTVNPAAPLLIGRRQIYKRLLTLSRMGPHHHTVAYTRIQARDIVERHALCNQIAESIAPFVGLGRLAPGTILLDVPDKNRERAHADLLLYRQRSDRPKSTEKPDVDDVGRSVFEASKIIRSLEAEFDQFAKKCRIFLEPTLYNELRDAGKLDDARKAAKLCLSRAIGLDA
jgi:HD superfamily phosphohydrolase